MVKTWSFSDRALPKSKYFDPDKFGTKISGIRCAANFTLSIFRWNRWEKSYCRKTRFFRTPKNGFFANKTHASTKELFSMHLKPMHNLQNFCSIEAFWWKFGVFVGEKVLVSLIFTLLMGKSLCVQKFSNFGLKFGMKVDFDELNNVYRNTFSKISTLDWDIHSRKFSKNRLIGNSYIYITREINCILDWGPLAL